MGTAEALGMAPSGGGASTEDEVAARTPWQLFWERFREDRVRSSRSASSAFEIVVDRLATPLIVRQVAHPPNAQFPSALDPGVRNADRPIVEVLLRRRLRRRGRVRASSTAPASRSRWH
jgi:hypothetical protein